MLGMARTAAARFSFLLSVPIILAASLLELEVADQEVPIDLAA